MINNKYSVPKYLKISEAKCESGSKKKHRPGKKHVEKVTFFKFELMPQCTLVPNMVKHPLSQNLGHHKSVKKKLGPIIKQTHNFNFKYFVAKHESGRNKM